MKQISIVNSVSKPALAAWGSIALRPHQAEIRHPDDLPLVYVVVTDVNTAKDIIQPLDVELTADAFKELNWDIVAVQIGEAIQDQVNQIGEINGAIYEVRAGRSRTSRTSLTAEGRLEEIGQSVVIQYRSRHAGFHHAVTNEHLMNSNISVQGDIVNLNLAVGSGVMFYTYNAEEAHRALENAVGGFYGTCTVNGQPKHFSLGQDNIYGNVSIPLNEYTFADGLLTKMVQFALLKAFPFLGEHQSLLKDVVVAGAGATMTDCALRGRSY